MKADPFKELLKKLPECTTEIDGRHGGISSVYSKFFTDLLKTEFFRVHRCDGYWKLPLEHMGHLLVEFKFGRKLDKKRELAKVFAQCVHYIHMIITKDGSPVPKVVCAATERECVFISGELLWSIAGKSSDFLLSPSAAGLGKDERLMECLCSSDFDKSVFRVKMDKEDFDIPAFGDAIWNIATSIGSNVLVEVTPHNIHKVWAEFKGAVFGDRRGNANEQVSVFVHYLTNFKDFAVNETGTRFTLNGREYDVHEPLRFDSFRRNYGFLRSPKQQRELTATCDRFVEDMNRRKKGEFYTPTPFVDYVHKMIEREFGENWKDEYVVWDCAWGTGNLTRDYKFKELYCSTLEQAELDIATGVNPEATKFQYDFLNDDFEKLPEGLQLAFKEGKKILFLINPPYGTGGTMCCEKMQGKNGLAKTVINAKMLEAGIGKASQNLYAQFLYRIMKMRKEWGVEVSICLFSPSLFLTGPAWKTFRNTFFGSFSYEGSIQFQASHFADVTTNWAIIFSLWKSGLNADNNCFKTTCVETDEEGEIVVNGFKTLYNLDGKSGCSSWVKEPVKKLKGVDAPQFASALKLRESGECQGKLVPAALGYFVSVGNNCNTNNTFNFLLSSCAAMGHGISILPQNFDRVVANFAARKLIDCNWMNSKDEYMVPNVEDPRYGEYQNDSIVFSIFNTASNQSSLRNITYKGKPWDIENEFFWMGADEMVELADSCGFESLYRDAECAGDRFVFKKLLKVDLSPEATAVLEKASEIVRKSFKYRKEVHEAHPEYHLNAWDAGWYQIKKLVAELPHMKADMDEFKVLFKALGDKMRPMVYELGFLKK